MLQRHRLSEGATAQRSSCRAAKHVSVASRPVACVPRSENAERQRPIHAPRCAVERHDNALLSKMHHL